jgi:peptidoglycan/xylan/chitin deacetylase (PgdA/CDA1 family)
LLWLSAVSIHLRGRRLARLPERLGRRLFSLAAADLIGPLTHVDTADPVAALTFDDGPHPVFTPRVLDVLDRHRARATFFMVGAAARRYPALVERVRGAGHAIGNHTEHHAPVGALGRRRRCEEIRACARALPAARPRLFRAPYGRVTVGVSVDAFALGYQTVAWSVDVGDWWDADSARMAADLEGRVGPGSVVLLHDAIVLPPEAWPGAPARAPHVDRSAMIAALDRALGAIGERLRCVTVPELLARGRPRRRGWPS